MPKRVREIPSDATPMIEKPPSKPPHGGELSEASERFGQPQEGWLDLSTGINPCPYPNTAVSAESLSRLPTSGALNALLAAARAAYGVPPSAGLCAAPGTQAILQILPEIVGAGDVAVVSPTYGEHAYLWRRAGHAVAEIRDVSRMGDARVVVIVNPNNPDGRITEPDRLDAVRADQTARGGLLIVDEAFADVAPHISLVSRADQPGLLVLRSFGKFFGLAGLRLGFAAGHGGLVDPLIARLGPWAVPGPAIEIGTRALEDRDWTDATRIRLAQSRERLDNLLVSNGLSVIGGTDLYRLVQCDDAKARFTGLAKSGILVRAFPDRPDLLRVGLPGNDAAFDRLDRSLKS